MGIALSNRSLKGQIPKKVRHRGVDRGTPHPRKPPLGSAKFVFDRASELLVAAAAGPAKAALGSRLPLR